MRSKIASIVGLWFIHANFFLLSPVFFLSPGNFSHPFFDMILASLHPLCSFTHAAFAHDCHSRPSLTPLLLPACFASLLLQLVFPFPTSFFCSLPLAPPQQPCSLSPSAYTEGVRRLHAFQKLFILFSRLLICPLIIC